MEKDFKKWKENEDEKLQKRIKNGRKIECKKSLYKSTYEGDAFTKGKTYILTIEDKYYWLVDNEGHEFSFTKTPGKTMYFIGDYFLI